MNKLESNQGGNSGDQEKILTGSFQKRASGLLTLIPDGQKALVVSLFGKRKEVSGPANVSSFSQIRMFNRVEVPPQQKIILYSPESNGGYKKTDIDGPNIVFQHPDGMTEEYQRVLVSEGENGWLFDKDGQHEEISGPKVIYIHPEGRFSRFQKVQMSERQACVLIEKSGKEKIIEGKDEPIIYINPEVEQLKMFQWTGSASSPDSEKVPGALRFQILRLDDTQTYFSFPVRTSDNAVLIVRLMIFYSIDNLEKLVTAGHDPLCGFYNKIQAGVTERVAGLSFDEFKKEPGKHISSIAELGNNAFADIGIEITKVALREWKPEDSQVQKTLERAAVVQTEKELDRAGHDRKMLQAGYQEAELKRQADLASLQGDVSRREGEQEGKKLVAMIEALKKSVNPQETISLMKLYLASQAQELNIGSAMLK